MNAQGQPLGMEALLGLLICVGIVLLILLVIQIFFLLTMMKTMKAVDERNRGMQPGMVFLTLIPLFGIVWAIILVNKMSESLEKEFDERRWNTSDEGFGHVAGSIWAWGGVVNVVLSILQNVIQAAGEPMIAMVLGVLGLPLGLAILVCWILYWVQIAQYGRRLREGGRGGLEEDYDDYSPPRRDREDYERNDEDELDRR